MDVLPPVGIVGAGRVGVAIGVALARAGVDVVAVAARSPAARARVAAELPAARILPVTGVADAAGLLLLAVPDDVLPELAGQLPAGGERYVGHTSGRYGVAVLGPAPARLAVHPVMTFAGEAADADRLAGATFGVTADDGARTVAAALVAACGGRVAWVPEEARALYHAALANAANHLVALVAQSADWLRAAGVPDPYAALAPLCTAALDGTLRAGDAALTGPVARGDAAAVAAHLDALSGREPDAVAGYVALARLAARRAHAAGRLDDAGLATLLAALPSVRFVGDDR